MSEERNITADAVALQERDEFRASGWLKVLAPAKVNLHLGIGERRADGYHQVTTVMHAVNLHDVVYVRRRASDTAIPDNSGPSVRMVQCGDVELPRIAAGDNIAVKAIATLAEACNRPTTDLDLEVRIEKNIPAEGGLGGGSSDAAAALLAAAQIWGLDQDDPAIEASARAVGADVAFFLRGGCALYEGTGDLFVRSFVPSKQAVALVKPDCGISTAEAYRAFDAAPVPVPADIASNIVAAHEAREIALFNNLAPAAERLAPELADIRAWMLQQPGVTDALLCGSGSTTFATCDDFAAACRLVAAARKRGWWARATSFGSVRAMVVSTEATR